MQALVGLLSYWISMLAVKREITGQLNLPCAIINPWFQETGFISEMSENPWSSGIAQKIMGEEYSIMNISSDPTVRMTSFVCSDNSKYLVERVLKASFCRIVHIDGLAAYENGERLIMPPLTMLDNIKDIKTLEKYRWMDDIIRFTGATQKFLDFSNSKRFSYSLSVNVKNAWNEMLRQTRLLWKEHPGEYEISWKETLCNEESSVKDVKKNLLPADMLARMLRHPKNDKEITSQQTRSLFMRSLW